MTCREVQELIHHFLDGELAEESESRIERHLLRCPSCAYETRSLEQARSLLRDALPRAEPSASYRERAEARLHAELADILKPPPLESTQWALPLSDD